MFPATTAGCGDTAGTLVRVSARRSTRHRPQRTLLYPLVQEYSLALKAYLSAQGTRLPRYVEQAFEDYLRCGRLEHVSYGYAAKSVMPSTGSPLLPVPLGEGADEQ